MQSDWIGASSFDPLDQIQTEKQQGMEWAMHLPKDFNVLVLYCDDLTSFDTKSLPLQYGLTYSHTNKGINFTPKIDISQMHIPFRYYQRVSQVDQSFALHIKLYDLHYYNAFYAFGHLDELLKQTHGHVSQALFSSLVSENDFDDIKEILFVNPLYMVVLFYLISFAQLILQVFTIKQQYQFWKNIENNQGISLKTLFYELLAHTIMLLYLIEKNSGKLIILFQFGHLFITVWKIFQAFKIHFNFAFPFIQFQLSSSYKRREQIDGQAVSYMNYILVPMLLLYTVWVLWTERWKQQNLYQFALESAASFTAIFGFVLMTPQLYLNYRLKSVEHLNWRGLIYRFLNTILDDLFALMVTMPLLRRIMYFRDDIIFIGYLYQRKIYKVDYSRPSFENGSAPSNISKKSE